MLRKRPKNERFFSKVYKARAEENPHDKNAFEMMRIFELEAEITEQKEQDMAWAQNNLEYDLRTSDWIAEKCADADYAQNLYAALCNNEFIKLDAWQILKDERWSCSWRHSGGIIADIRQEGDYIDWYCSGSLRENQVNSLRSVVPEGIITDEIRQDLENLGWGIVSSTEIIE